MRRALVLLVTAAALLLGAVAIGRAVDDSARQYVTFTRAGVTLECERITDVAGRTFYDSCERVP
jgi:hypothetical protein